MTVHFICVGNNYRSRLADTYLKSLRLPDINVISSGIEAEKNEVGTVSWYAQRIMQKSGLVQFEKPLWQQTTKNLLKSGDLTIFFTQDVYDYCRDNYGFDSKKYEV